jgi:hypothetical protein
MVHDDETLLAAFETGRLPCDAFHHREHLRAAFLCLRRAGDFAEGSARFCTALQAFAAGCGCASKYQEALTLQWLTVIHRRMNGAKSSEEFLAANADLMAR